MKSFIVYTLLLVAFSLNVMAQGPIPPDPDDVPIDGGLSFLVAGGLAYGAYQYKKRKQDK